MQRLQDLKRPHLLHPSKHPPALWWPCAATTALVKSAPSWRLPVAVASSVIAVKAAAMDDPQTAAIAVVVQMIASVTVPSARIVAPVWVMRLSAPSAMRWNTLK